jgi:5-amino-6-(5-phosphoribosylamino)uracil reductase
VLLSCATSADGYLDDASPSRLILSGPADLDRVDEVRAGCDAIMVGAQTVRKDNPRLLIRDPRRRARRAARGRPEHPTRVTLTGTGDLDPRANFFASGAPRLVYCATRALPRAHANLQAHAVLIDAGDPVSLDVILEDLAERCVARLLVEGGARVLADFLAQDLADEFHLAIAPFFLAGPNSAPRLNLPAPAPASGPSNPMTLAETRRVEEMVLLRYLLGPGGPEHRFLRWAVELSRLCPPSATAFSVGAVIVGEDGEVLATGFSREQEDHDHAEEVALRKLGPDPRLRHATIYSSLVPCGARASRPLTCVQRIVAAGIPRVVFAWREPALFTAGEGAEQLRAAGVAVTEVPELADRARAVNAHLVGR